MLLLVPLALAEPAAIVDFPQGTGFVVSPEGHVLTNVHVEARERARVVVDGVPVVADLVALDTELDLALYRLRVDEPVPWIPIREARPTKHEPVTCLGYPKDRLRESEGRLRSKPQELGVMPVVEHDAPTRWGSSGSPLLDAQGEAVGMHWAWAPERGALLAIDLPAAAERWEPLAGALPQR